MAYDLGTQDNGMTMEETKMNRREFIEAAGMMSAAGLTTATGISSAEGNPSAPLDPAALAPLQQKMGYSDAELKQFLGNPRNLKILERLSVLSQTNVVFEIVESHGCLVGHAPGEQFIFPSAGSLDTNASAPRLCPFLMPPMTRLLAVIQERVWEGLDPAPLFHIGQCDDVGLDCSGLGKVLIEAKIEINETELSG